MVLCWHHETETNSRLQSPAETSLSRTNTSQGQTRHRPWCTIRCIKPSELDGGKKGRGHPQEGTAGKITERESERRGEKGRADPSARKPVGHEQGSATEGAGECWKRSCGWRRASRFRSVSTSLGKRASLKGLLFKKSCGATHTAQNLQAWSNAIRAVSQV